MVGEAVEERSGHLGVAEDAGPFAEGEIGGDDDGDALVEPADEVEQQLAAGLGEGQIAQFVEHDEVEAAEMVGELALPAGAGLGVKLVDEVDDVEEAAAGAAADAGADDRDGDVGLSGAGAADHDRVALLLDEASGGEIAHQRLADRRAVEIEVLEVLGDRQLRGGELVLDRARLLLGELGLEQLGDDCLRFILPLHGDGDDLVVSRLHAVELQLGHRGEDLGSLHQWMLLRLS